MVSPSRSLRRATASFYCMYRYFHVSISARCTTPLRQLFSSRSTRVPYKTTLNFNYAKLEVDKEGLDWLIQHQNYPREYTAHRFLLITARNGW